MNINKRKFFSLLDRMEKKGTLNESIANKRILTEGGVSKVLKSLKNIDTAKITLKLQKFAVGSPVRMSTQTDNLASTVNSGMKNLVDQITKLSKGIPIPNKDMVVVSVIMKSFDNFVDSFVDIELARLRVLDGLDKTEKFTLKQWLKGKQHTLGYNISKKLDMELQTGILYELRETYKMNKNFATLSSFMGATMNSKGFTDVLLGLMNRDGNYFTGLDSSIDKILEIHDVINSKWPIGSKDIDGLDIAGQDVWPQFKSKWNAIIDEIGKKNGIDGLDQKKIMVDGAEVYDLVSIKNSIKTIIKSEIKNKKGVKLFTVKYRSKINSVLRRKKTKNIPKAMKAKTNGQIDDVDISKAIIVDTGKGMDIFVVKDKKSREQLMKFFKDEGIKHGDLIDWVTGNKGALEGGRDISQINKRIKFRIWLGVILPVTYGLPALTFYLWCKSKLNKVAQFTPEQKTTLATKGIDNPGGVIRSILKCGEMAWAFPFNLAMLWVDDIIQKEIYPELVLVIDEIEEKITEACDKYKKDNDVPCCNIDCNGEIGDEAWKGGIKKSLEAVMKMPRITEAIENSGESLSEVIMALDKEGQLNGLFTTDGQPASVDDVIKTQCIKMVTTEDNVKCIMGFLKTTWSDLVNFENIKDNECNPEAIKDHINTKINMLKYYEKYITFDDEQDNKFNIKQEKLPGTLQEYMVGKIKNLEDLRKGYLKIVNGIVTQFCSGDNSSGSEEVGEIEAGDLTSAYGTLKDMVMDLYGKKVWGVDCDDYAGWTDDDVEDSMFLYFLEDYDNGLFSSEQGYWGQVGDAFNWWYPKYKDLCGEGEVTPVTPDNIDDEDIDGEDDEDIF